jgi:starch phosphorylase
MIRRIFGAASELQDVVKIIYLEDYSMEIGKLICSGVDLWLNNPQRPLEASGTSGMKAALNGVPSLSIRDGWWSEGHIEGVTGWSIESPEGNEINPFFEASSLYHKLEHVILPMFYNRPDDYAGIMRSAIYLNGSFFNTHRMILQYRDNAYNQVSSVSRVAQIV